MRVRMRAGVLTSRAAAVRADLARLDELVTSSLEFRNNLAEADLSALNMHDVTIVFLGMLHSLDASLYSFVALCV